MGLKVFDLQCSNLHVFEGWFSSHEDYDSQQSRGLVACPICQSDKIEKRLSAPRLNVGHFKELAQQTEPAQTTSVVPAANVMAPAPASQELAQLQALVLKQMREYVSKTENVGNRFAEEARRIHEGEATERPIRGTATWQEQKELVEEGIGVVQLPDFLDTDRLQ